jgi:ATP phosphoribosyltransferase
MNNLDKIRIALTKGRLLKNAVELFERGGYDCYNLKNMKRKLIIPVGDTLEAVPVKAADVITYVERGVCDIGIVGKDTILEQGHNLFEFMDLGFGKCRFVVAGLDKDGFNSGYSRKIIATKYPNVAREYFDARGMDIEIIRIEGSVEIAPLLGMSDAIVDIVETGDTLRENGLVEYETIADISARLVANKASMKLKKDAIMTIMNALNI